MTPTCFALLPSPEEVLEEIPCTDLHTTFIDQSRRSIEAILRGKDSRKLFVIGPCSIHDLQGALEYAEHFRELSDKVSDKIFLVMRTYFEKPRSVIGWKGLLYDPNFDGSCDFTKGIRLSRTLLSQLTEMGVPVGCELLELMSSYYYADFLSWGCIGARTSTSPPHRQLAASLPFPIGFKNTIDGSIENAVCATISAGAAQNFLGLSLQGSITKIRSSGNPNCHIVLRGGSKGPNYHPLAVNEAIQKCRDASVHDGILVDCSHDNCGKEHFAQKIAFQSVVDQIIAGNNKIIGLMLESNLYEGAQPISPKMNYGISITDPCLDWSTTRDLILKAYANFR